MTFQRVLIANRGEIAVRLIRTLRVMGLTSIAVYSEADRGALHVRLADVALPLGGSTVGESYLDPARLLDAARRARAEAIIPGYGFLSENADFAQACNEAGFVFIGPSPHSIRQMGSKIEARELAQAANVPLIPGGPADSLEQAHATAATLGFPLMLKASAGGGGKGMRLVPSKAALDDAFPRAQSEALRSFGSSRVYLEKAITTARHIEVQVLGDRYGNLVSLGERECSVQRRHQKVVEECPAPGLATKTRQALSDAALSLARAVEYHSVGTLEFLVDTEENFYFLEMNTRLQVEHTVTEMVTGLDLVEWMVRVARGETLADLPDTSPRGWAIQARLCAEDPSQQYQPSVGTLELLREPGGAGIRFDHWLQPKTEVTSYYDPLLGKLCAHAATRELARRRLLGALRELVLTGISTNREQLEATLQSPEFASGKYSTNLLAHVSLGPSTPPTLQETAVAAAGLAWTQRTNGASSRTQDGAPSADSQQASDWVRAFRPN
jgi:acetyl/propionyl-CoA carboxylase alpha subunit